MQVSDNMFTLPSRSYNAGWPC